MLPNLISEVTKGTINVLIITTVTTIHNKFAREDEDYYGFNELPCKIRDQHITRHFDIIMLNLCDSYTPINQMP